MLLPALPRCLRHVDQLRRLPIRKHQEVLCHVGHPSNGVHGTTNIKPELPETGIAQPPAHRSQSSPNLITAEVRLHDAVKVWSPLLVEFHRDQGWTQIGYRTKLIPKAPKRVAHLLPQGCPPLEIEAQTESYCVLPMHGAPHDQRLVHHGLPFPVG